MERTSTYLNNFFDYDKWCQMYDPQANAQDPTNEQQ
jgi:hypothetical protein